MMKGEVLETKVVRVEMETKSLESPLDPIAWEKRQRQRAQRYAEYLRRREEEGDGYDE